MLRKTPLKKRREKPRRNEGRIQHQRSRPKAGSPPTAAEKAHMGRIAAMGCLVCGKPATVHHVTSDGMKRIARSHKRVAPLCETHHQIQFGARESVEALSHAGFTKKYGIDLLEWADQAWEQSNAVASS